MKVSRKMWLILSILFTVLFTVFLTTCAPKITRLKNIGDDYSLDDTKGWGVIIVSLTHSGTGVSSMFVDLRGVDNDFKGEVFIIEEHSFFIWKKVMDWKCPMFGKTPEDKPCGRLAIIELPQGEYEFYSWRGYKYKTVGTPPNVTRVLSHVAVWPPPEFSKRFKVIAGKVVYLGNLHISTREKLRMGNFLPYMDFRYTVKVADMRERDLPLAYQKNPRITADKEVINILQ